MLWKRAEEDVSEGVGASSATGVIAGNPLELSAIEVASSSRLEVTLLSFCFRAEFLSLSHVSRYLFKRSACIVNNSSHS